MFDNENTAGAFTWWNGTRQETYGPGKGYILLDYMNTNPPVFNERDTGNTWYICTQATREPCTDVAGVIVNYLYDCKPNFGHGGTKLIPPPYNSGGINNKGDFACGAEGNDHAIRILQAAVQEKFADSDITALSGQPMYCNWDANGDNSNVCVYYQGTATGNGTLTDYLMTQMNNAYDSDTCGNIPVDYPEVDWLAFNYLTVSSNTPPCEPCTSFDVTDVVTGKVISTTTCACPGFPS